MSKAKETMTLASMRGTVCGTWFGAGVSYPAFRRHNQLGYSCCDALAQLLAGNVAYVPRYIGFVYGPEAEPADLALSSDRSMTWPGLTAEMAAIGGNIQVAPFTYSPTIAVDGEAGRYGGNATVFGAHTRSGSSGVYAFPLQSPYAGVLANGARLYHAVLLAKPVPGSEYLPLARVNLRDTGDAFPVKPDGFELGLDWQISLF